MKKMIFLSLIATFSLLFIGCNISNSPIYPERPVYHAVVSGTVVNEEGQPIPNICYTDKAHQIEWQDEIYTDEDGKFSFELSAVDAGTVRLVNIAFVDVDDEKNGSYETLNVGTKEVELVWNGKTLSETPNHELFEPIDLGTFVMKKK